MITPYNILRHELVGLGVKAQSGKKTVEGVVDDETAKTLRIKTQTGVEKAVKDSVMLEFKLPGDAVVEVEGRLIEGRPEDRIKKKHRIRF
ncbi:MAG: ribonuclease P protein subunit [Candidatus Altiarchaeota archaeon]